MQKLPQVTRNVKVPAKPHLNKMPKMQESLARAEASLGNEGRVLFRYSGTESLARITIEGPELLQIRTMSQELEDVLLADIANTLHLDTGAKKT